METGFPWMTYCIALFLLVVLSLGLSLLSPHSDGGKPIGPRQFGLPPDGPSHQGMPAGRADPHPDGERAN